MPHPALSKGEGFRKMKLKSSSKEAGFKKSEAKVLSFGEDLGEAKLCALLHNA